jgi:putative DNA primase/helicase
MGAAILPVIPAGKKPAIQGGAKAASRNKTVIDHWFKGRPNLNIGIATGAKSEFFAIDVDGPEGKASLEALTHEHGLFPKTVVVKTPRGFHGYFKSPDYPVPNSVGRIARGIDIRSEGAYVVGPGSETPAGRYYFLPGHGPEAVQIATPPDWLLALIGKKPTPAEVTPVSAPKLSATDRVRSEAYGNSMFRGETDRLRKAPLHQRNDTLNTCAYKCGRYVAHGLLDRAVVTATLTQIAKSIGLDDAEILPTIESGLTAGIKNPARLKFLKTTVLLSAEGPPRASDSVLAKELSRLGENDVANAERFARRFGHRVIFSERRGWMVYDGKRYRPDGHLSCMELGKKVVTKIADELPFLAEGNGRTLRARFAETSKSKGGIDRMLDLAKGLLVVRDSALDADPWLLNTETCTIDLRTGTYHPHDARDLITKIAPVKARANSKCPLFKGLLARITGGDQELAGYIQKAVGLSLTGITSEQVMFFVFGKAGNNGKSTLVNLIRDMLGDYGCHTPTETLLTKQYDNAIPADLARLAGARMVTAIESNVHRQLDEAKIKTMTGGEPITARHLYQNFFEFTPQFKLWLVANDRPHVRSTDPAIWRRIRVIPLNVKIPANEVDRSLSEKLRAELPGILSWAVRGALKWQQEGLAEPEAVKAASAGWRAAVDHVRRFVTDTIVTGCTHDAVIPAGELHSRFKQWCAHQGEKPLSPAQFKAKLEEAFDLTHAQTSRGSEWRGIKWKN